MQSIFSLFCDYKLQKKNVSSAVALQLNTTGKKPNSKARKVLKLVRNAYLCVISFKFDAV